MGKNQVTLTFAGDAKQLSKTIDRISSDTDSMSKTVDKAGSTARGGLDRITDGADRGEQRIIGMRDGITGTSDLMKGWRTGSMELVLTGMADLASSVANFAGPTLSALAAKLGITTAATNVKAAAMKALNTVMKANTIVLVVTALVLLGTALVVAYQRSSTFRSIVQGAFSVVKAAGDAVKNAVLAIPDAIRAAKDNPVIGAIVAWYGLQFRAIRAVIQTVAGAVGAIIDAISNAKDSKAIGVLRQVFGTAFSAIKSVINSVADAVQNVIDKVSTATSAIGSLISKAKNIPGAGLAGKLFANGGIVTSPTNAVIGEAGPEVVIPLTRPRRAAELMRATGLDRGAGGGGGAMVNVQTMIVQDATDVYRVSSSLGRLLAVRGFA